MLYETECDFVLIAYFVQWFRCWTHRISSILSIPSFHYSNIMTLTLRTSKCNQYFFMMPCLDCINNTAFNAHISAMKIIYSNFQEILKITFMCYLFLDFEFFGHKKKSTSRQRSGKDAIRKRLPLQKPRWEKTKLTIRYLYHENIS